VNGRAEYYTFAALQISWLVLSRDTSKNHAADVQI
jgi:hypothetical protein